MFRKAKTFLLVGLSALILSSMLELVGIIPMLDKRTKDLRFVVRNKLGLAPLPHPGIVIVAIDEKSINELGRWPWSRKVIAELIDRIRDYRAKVIALDVIFSEYESKEADRALAEAIGKGGVILGYFFRDTATQKPSKKALEQLSISSIKKLKIKNPKGFSHIKEFKFVELNIPDIGENADGFGYFNFYPDEDGIFRAYTTIFKFRGAAYPALAVEALRRYTGGEISLSILEYGIEELKIGNFEVPATYDEKLLLNFYGPAGTFKHYSAVDVIKRRLSEGELRDNLIFVGATEIGIYDLRATPVDPVFPGVEIHATAASNILKGDFLIASDLVNLSAFLITTVITLLLSLLLSKVRNSFFGILLAFLFVLVYMMINFQVFLKGYNLPVLFPITSILLTSIASEAYRNLVVERSSKYLKRALSSYVSPQVMSEILRNPDVLKLGGERREITVMFSDIRGFTSLSENLEPEALVSLLNSYLGPMTKIIMEGGGTLDKYIGDAIMAIWNAPVLQEGHPDMACEVAIKMLNELKRLHTEWEKMGLPKLDIGIGMNTGEAVVGNMGADVRFDYTAIGDTVNLASRFEGLNKIYGTNIIVSEFTKRKIKDNKFNFRILDLVRVKGREKPVVLYELRLEDDGLAELFEKAYNPYREGDFKSAFNLFVKIHEKYPQDIPTKIHLERCRELIKSPPREWSGVFEALTK